MIIAVIVGVITGVIASWVAWWVLHHAMAPKIGFSEVLKKQKTGNSKTGYYYQFKFGNLKKRTEVVDISVRASIYLPDFPSNGVTNIYTIPIDGKYIYELTPQSNENQGWARRISLKVNDPDFLKTFEKTFFDEKLKELAKNEMITLEDLLKITEKAFVRVYIASMDAFSGSRKVVKSKNYRLVDIQFGKYERLSLEFTPTQENNA